MNILCRLDLHRHVSIHCMSMEEIEELDVANVEHFKEEKRDPSMFDTYICKRCGHSYSICC